MSSHLVSKNEKIKRGRTQSFSNEFNGSERGLQQKIEGSAAFGTKDLIVSGCYIGWFSEKLSTSHSESLRSRRPVEPLHLHLSLSPPVYLSFPTESQRKLCSSSLHLVRPGPSALASASVHPVLLFSDHSTYLENYSFIIVVDVRAFVRSDVASEFSRSTYKG